MRETVSLGKSEGRRRFFFSLFLDLPAGTDGEVDVSDGDVS